jgi:hypothetical protein
LYTPPPPEQEVVKVIKVEMHGNFAIVSFRQKQPSKQASVWLWQGVPKQKGEPLRFQFATSNQPKLIWTIQVNYLKPNTKYLLEIHLTNANGDSVSPAYTYATPVKTLQRDVTISLQKVHVIEDGEKLDSDCGDFVFDWAVDVKEGFLRFSKMDVDGDLDSICDGETWVPNILDVGLKTFTIIRNWTLHDVDSDTVTVMVMPVDLDYDAGLPGNGFGTNGYGGAKNLADSVDWAEGKTSIDVGPKAFTHDGEVFFENGVQVEAIGCNTTCIDVVWTFNFKVTYS